ncbi:MAG: aminomethyl-transferring glycine dehydrogenase subunit GcvPA [Asgard group archaeon]|nr:aminomethyl-transferring glycine dehydrogenase subunit GcvPA [Asgard group archaeon]
MANEAERSAKKIQQEMESYLNIKTIDELFKDVPSSVLLKKSLDIPGPFSERDLKLHIQNILSKNKECITFLGGGAQKHYVPALVTEVITKPELQNSYTPYQPEVSQGMLQGIFEYQSLISELTNMSVTNASMYDWATAAAEALLMAARLLRKRSKVLISSAVHPDRIEVIENYLEGPKIGIEYIDYNPKTGEIDTADLKEKITEDIAAFYFETPNCFGIIEKQAEQICDIIHEKGAKAIVGVDPVSLALLKPPGDFGADIAVGEAQALGLPVNYGGPHVGFFSINYDRNTIRQMPGRLVGLTKTEEGDKKAFVLTLATREQHIRRERATSNICTNQSLLAFGAGVYLSLLGYEGLKGTAEYCTTAAHYVANKIDALANFDAPFFSGAFYNEFVFRVKNSSIENVLQKLQEINVIGGYSIKHYYPDFGEAALCCVTEMNTKEEIDTFLKQLAKIDKSIGGKK